MTFLCKNRRLILQPRYVRPSGKASVSRFVRGKQARRSPAVVKACGKQKGPARLHPNEAHQTTVGGSNG